MNLLSRFLWLVLLFSAPLWLAAGILDATNIISVALPLSALRFLAVILASIMVTRGSGGSVRELLLCGIDIRCIETPRGRWYIYAHAAQYRPVIPDDIVERGVCLTG